MSGDYWSPDQRFNGKTVLVLGGGPSLPDLERHRGSAAIAVNTAAEAAPWAEVLFFRDGDWLRQNRSLVQGWAGLAVTSCRVPEMPANVRTIALVRMDEFPPLRSGIVRYGRSSGHAAVALAIAMGAARVILLGFDCRVIAGRSHFHNRYGVTDGGAIYAGQFLPAWRGWDAAAKRVGVEILNATPGSAITEFATITLD